MACVFCVAVRADDLDTLNRVRDHLGIGSVRVVDPPSGRGKQHAQARWWIESKRDTQELVRFLDQYPLQAKKSRDFDTWRRAVVLKASVYPSSGRLTPQMKAHNCRVRGELSKLKTQLQEGRSYTHH